MLPSRKGGVLGVSGYSVHTAHGAAVFKLWGPKGKGPAGGFGRQPLPVEPWDCRAPLTSE